jgi:membrane associated rhomboid family serine protease
VIIVPLGHERSIARRWPWVTTAIILLNVTVFFALLVPDRRATAELQARVTQALEYCSEHPELELPPTLLELVPNATRRTPDEATAEPADAEVQAELDGYVQQIQQAREQLSVSRYGYHDSRGAWSGLLTHQFLHAGLLHLLFNMWFLWLVGCNVEDAWGRVLFPAFYLSGGAVAGLVHAGLAEPSSRMLIGASGAVAAAMGAFLVGFSTTKIRFLYLLLIRPRTFWAPAYVMLPLWVGAELLWGVVDAGSGVAHWAHVGGFGFGFVVALGVRLIGLEKHLAKDIEQQAEEYVADPRLIQASAAIDADDAATALPVLEALCRARTVTPLAFTELARAQQALGDVSAAQQTKLRLLSFYLQKQWADEALGVFDELRAEQASELVPPNLRLRLARQYRNRGDVERAGQAFEEVHRAVERTEHSLPALLAHAEMLLELGQKAAAHSLYERARSFVSRDVQVEAAIRQGLARASPARSSTVPPPPA